jgi:hypothetical protein
MMTVATVYTYYVHHVPFFLLTKQAQIYVLPTHPKKKTMFSACQLYKYRDQTKGSMHVLRSMYTVL